jgi:hypothetical protein
MYVVFYLRNYFASVFRYRQPSLPGLSRSTISCRVKDTFRILSMRVVIGVAVNAGATQPQTGGYKPMKRCYLLSSYLYQSNHAVEDATMH